jgi:hypothetical protein
MAPPRGIAERTAGALKRYAKQPPATRAEEKDAFARAVAAEVARVADAWMGGHSLLPPARRPLQ